MLIIKDLEINKELDSKAMASIYGGRTYTPLRRSIKDDYISSYPKSESSKVEWEFGFKIKGTIDT